MKRIANIKRHHAYGISWHMVRIVRIGRDDVAFHSVVHQSLLPTDKERLAFVYRLWKARRDMRDMVYRHVHSVAET